MSASVSSHSNSSSPERKCLGGLMKDIEEELPREDSKDETAYKTLSEQKLSLDSIYPYENAKNKLNNISTIDTPIFNLSMILAAFNSQKTTIILQKSLNEMSQDNLEGIIKEMKGYFSAIIKNKNGNYFCSDLLKVCTKEQRIEILKEIGTNLIDDCTDEYGTHPIQTLIELANSEEEYKLLLYYFRDFKKILKATLNQNGTYVIQKLIVYIPEKYRMEFNLIFVKFICILAMDMYGVCTAIKFINYTKNEIIEKLLLNIILSNFVTIAENQYGNYLIQNIMEHWWNTNKGIFLKKICMEKFHKLARNHYSSYVCDIFLKLSNLQDKKILMNMLINGKTINSFDNNNCGKIIINKLMKGLKQNNMKSNNNTGKKNSQGLNNNTSDIKNKEKPVEDKKQ
jgi:hypothetical protein